MIDLKYLKLLLKKYLWNELNQTLEENVAIYSSNELTSLMNATQNKLNTHVIYLSLKNEKSLSHLDQVSSKSVNLNKSSISWVCSYDTKWRKNDNITVSINNINQSYIGAYNCVLSLNGRNAVNNETNLRKNKYKLNLISHEKKLFLVAGFITFFLVVSLFFRILTQSLKRFPNFSN